jgi:stalled ribosome rescue protein Dom34
MKKTGVWLDKKKALIVNLDETKENLITVKSNVEDYRISGGSGTKFKGGPQDVVQDSKYLERQKHQLQDYFKELASLLNESQEIVLFGPAGTNEKFYKTLQKKYKPISEKVSAVQKSDSMTSNQIVALVKKYYKFL